MGRRCHEDAPPSGPDTHRGCPTAIREHAWTHDWLTVPDEPTLGEVMRRLDEAIRQVTELARQMHEDRADAARTYVRQDVYLAQRQADQAVVADLQGDVSRVETQSNAIEDKRRANVRWAIGVALSIAALLLTVLGLVLQGGTS